MPLDKLLARHARYRPSHVALVFEDERLTFTQLDERVNRVANALTGLGLEKGDKIATMLENGAEAIELYHAAARTGVVVVPLSPLLRGGGLTNLVNDSDARILITNAAMVPEIDRLRADLPGIPDDGYVLVDGAAPGYLQYHELIGAAGAEPGAAAAIDRDDPYNIVYSSGTTGLPKGIVHTHAIREAYCTGFAASFRIKPESVLLHSGSLVFNGAFVTLMPAFYLGCTYVLMARFDADHMIELIEREQVTHTMLVPSQLIALLQRPRFGEERCASLEMICSVGAPLHLDHKQELERRLPGRFYELYGLTEGFATVLDRDDAERKAGSVGVPPPLYEMRIVDEGGADLPAGEIGEIVGRGPITMPGYYKRPDLTRADDPGGVDPHGRPRSRRRGRVPLPRRPQEGPHHLRRRERLSAGHRGGRGVSCGSCGGRRLRRPRGPVGGDARRGGDAPGRRDGPARGNQELGEPEGGGPLPEALECRRARRIPTKCGRKNVAP